MFYTHLYFLIFSFLAVSTVQACYEKENSVVFLNCTKFSFVFLSSHCATLAPSSSHGGFLGIRPCTYLGTSCWRSIVPDSLVLRWQKWEERNMKTSCNFKTPHYFFSHNMLVQYWQRGIKISKSKNFLSLAQLGHSFSDTPTIVVKYKFDNKSAAA